MYVDAVIWGIWIQIFLQWWKLGSQTLTGTGWASSWRLVGANPLCFLLRSFSLVQQVSSISYLNQIALEILFGMLQWPCRPMAQALLDTWRSTRIKARMPCGGACRQHSTHGLRNSGRTKLNFLRTKCWILPTTSLWILKLKVKPLRLQIVGPHFFFLEDLDTAQGIAWCYTSWGVQGFLCSYPMPSPRAEKEGVRQRAKLVKQLEDKQTLCPKSKFNLQWYSHPFMALRVLQNITSFMISCTP